MKSIKIEIYRDKAKEYRWRIRASNGRVLADSAEGYKRRGGAFRGMRAVVIAISDGRFEVKG